jgi:outer membrane protein assembly factor BamB
MSIFRRERVRLWTSGLVGLYLSAVANQTVRAADWPNWRGPDHNGISSESGWLDHWPAAGPMVAWKANVGIGFSGFCVANGRVYTAGNADNTDTFFCFDAESGKVLWKYSYPADLGDKYFEGGPTATAATERGHSYFCSRWGNVFCFEAATGKVLWATNIQKETGCRIPDWGFAGSPLLYKTLVVLNIGDAGVGLEKATGKIVWKSGKKEAGYSTPLPVQFNGQTLALFADFNAYLAVNPETGKEIWRVRWLTQGGINVADPLVSGDKFLISSGYGKGSELLQMTPADPNVLWKNRQLGTHISPGVLIGHFAYLNTGQASSGGPLTCIDFDTGQIKWQSPHVGAGGLIAADGKLIAMTERGEILIAPASPDGFNPTARAKVLDGKTWAPPVLANGRIYVRNALGDVVCLDVRKE